MNHGPLESSFNVIGLWGGGGRCLVLGVGDYRISSLPGQEVANKV